MGHSHRLTLALAHSDSLTQKTDKSQAKKERRRTDVWTTKRRRPQALGLLSTLARRSLSPRPTPLMDRSACVHLHQLKKDGRLCVSVDLASMSRCRARPKRPSFPHPSPLPRSPRSRCSIPVGCFNDIRPARPAVDCSAQEPERRPNRTRNLASLSVSETRTDVVRRQQDPRFAHPTLRRSLV